MTIEKVAIPSVRIWMPLLLLALVSDRGLAFSTRSFRAEAPVEWSTKKGLTRLQVASSWTTATAQSLSSWFNAFAPTSTQQVDERKVVDVDDDEVASKQEYDRVLFLSAAVPPLLASLFYGEIAHYVAYTCDHFGFPGSNVDGNAFANNLLRPTINGVVVPAAGVGTGTLFATTVNVLWNRQLMLRSSINTEVCELRHLRRALFGCFGTVQHVNRRKTALHLLLSYTRTVIAETQVDCIPHLEEIQLTQGISKNELDGTCECVLSTMQVYGNGRRLRNSHFTFFLHHY